MKRKEEIKKYEATNNKMKREKEIQFKHECTDPNGRMRKEKKR